MALKHRKQRKGDISTVTGVVVGVVTSVLITFVLAALSALLVVNEHIPFSSAKYVVILIWVVSTLFGSIVAGTVVTQKKLIARLIACGAYLLLLISMAITLFDGLGQTVLIGAISILIASGGAILIALKPKKGARSLRKIRVSR